MSTPRGLLWALGGAIAAVGLYRWGPDRTQIQDWVLPPRDLDQSGAELATANSQASLAQAGITLADYLEIQALVARHFEILAAADSLDQQARLADTQARSWADTFTPDGTLTILAADGKVVSEARGRGALLTAYRQLVADQATRYWLQDWQLEPAEEGVRLTSTFVATTGASSPTTILHSGMYEDRLVRLNRQWRFVSRRLHLDPS